MNRCSVVKKPTDNFNASSHCLEKSHSCVAMNIEALLHIPNVILDAENIIWMESEEVRKDLLESLCLKIFEECVSFNFKEERIEGVEENESDDFVEMYAPCA